MRMVSNVYSLKEISEDNSKQHLTKLALFKENPGTGLTPTRNTNSDQLPISLTTDQEPPQNIEADIKIQKTEFPPNVYEDSNSQVPVDQLPILARSVFTNDSSKSSHTHELKCKFHDCKNGVSIEGSRKPSIIYLNKDFDIESCVNSFHDT